MELDNISSNERPIVSLYLCSLLCKAISLDKWWTLNKSRPFHQFFRHDLVHASNDKFFLARSDRTRAEIQEFAQNYRNYRETLPFERDRRAAFEFGYFFITHEIGIYADDLMRGSKNILARRSDMEKLITDPTWFGHEEIIPAWARADKRSAKKFMEIVNKELDLFAIYYNSL